MRNTKTVTAWAIYLHVLLLGCTYQETVSSAEKQPVISDIQAQLFFGSTGGFSRNVLKGTDYVLWNVVIGEGTDHGWSEETLVIVELSSEPDANYSDHVLNFKATYKVAEVDSKDKLHMRNITVKGKRKVNSFSASGKKYFGFWLNNTGCIPVQIQASISPGKSVTKTEIPFHCGE